MIKLSTSDKFPEQEIFPGYSFFLLMAICCIFLLPSLLWAEDQFKAKAKLNPQQQQDQTKQLIANQKFPPVCQPVPGQGPEMVIIPAGTFDIGEPGKQQSVTFKKPFSISRCEITFADYQQFAEATLLEIPDDHGWGRESRPVINVSWDDAVAYARWLSNVTGRDYRLPTEAQWEYAARAGTQTAYWWGNAIGNNRANCDGCGSQWDNKMSASAGSFPANPFKLYDTVGNVWEWVQDCYHDNYQDMPADGSAWEKPAGKGTCDARVLRGGSWNLSPGFARASLRFRGLPGDRFYDFGFRVVCLSP